MDGELAPTSRSCEGKLTSREIGMANVVRPISRLMAVELEDIEVDSVGGGDGAVAAANTDVYCKKPSQTQGFVWQYDYSHPD